MVSGVLLLSLVASAGATGSVKASCSSLLEGVSAAGHSDVELAVYCRAAYPTEMCKSMRSALGSQPWAPGRIASTCSSWEHQARLADLTLSAERRMMSYEDFQDTLDTCAATKANYGYNVPRNRDGSVDLDGTVQKKIVETQKVTRAYNQYYGGAEPATNGVGLWQNARHPGGGLQPMVALASALMVGATALAIGGMALLSRRAGAVASRQSARRQLLPVQVSSDAGDSPLVPKSADLES